MPENSISETGDARSPWYDDETGRHHRRPGPFSPTTVIVDLGMGMVYRISGETLGMFPKVPA